MFNTVLAQKINKELIEKERFVLYMNEMPRNYIGSILVGLPLFYFIFQSQSSLYAVNIWFTFDAILMITALLTYYAFYQHYDTFHFSIWIKVSDIPLIVFSLHIALAPWLFLQSEADIYLFTLFIMIISLTAVIILSC